MGIEADETGDILDVGEARRVDFRIEQRIELLHEAPIAPHPPDQLGGILRSVPTVLPRIALGVVAITGDGGIERLAEFAIAVTRPDKPRLLIEHITPVSRALPEPGRHILTPHGLRDPGDRPVVVSILEGFRGALTVLVRRHPTQLHILVEP